MFVSECHQPCYDGIHFAETVMCVFFLHRRTWRKKNKTKNTKTCIDSLESTFMAVMNSRSAVLKGQKKAITAERPSRLWPRERERERGRARERVYVCLGGRREDYRTGTMRPICCWLWPICSLSLSLTHTYTHSHSEAVNHQEEANINYNTLLCVCVCVFWPSLANEGSQ